MVTPSISLNGNRRESEEYYNLLACVNTHPEDSDRDQESHKVFQAKEGADAAWSYARAG